MRRSPPASHHKSKARQELEEKVLKQLREARADMDPDVLQQLRDVVQQAQAGLMSQSVQDGPEKAGQESQTPEVKINTRVDTNPDTKADIKSERAEDQMPSSKEDKESFFKTLLEQVSQKDEEILEPTKASKSKATPEPEPNLKSARTSAFHHRDQGYEIMDKRKNYETIFEFMKLTQDNPRLFKEVVKILDDNNS